jgi:hypothetical protein
MTAGGQHDETFAFDNKVRSNLVFEIIGNEAAGVLCRRNVVRETPEPADDPDPLAAWPQRFFEAALCDLAGSEGMVSNDGRPSAIMSDRFASKIAFRSSAPYWPTAVWRMQKQSSPPTKKGRAFFSRSLFAERKPTSPPK